MSTLREQQHNIRRMTTTVKISFNPEDNLFRATLSEPRRESKFMEVRHKGRGTRVHHALVNEGFKEQFVSDPETFETSPSGQYTTSVSSHVLALSPCDWVSLEESARLAIKASSSTSVSSYSMEADLDVPENVAGFRPYPHQKAGVKFIQKCWNRSIGALVADSMGVGKSTQAALAILLQPDVNRTLLVVPKGIMHQWVQQELSIWLNTGDPRFCKPSSFTPNGWKFDDDSIQVMESTREPIMGKIVIVNHKKMENASSWKRIKEVKWDCIIVDEAHTFFNPEAKMSSNFFTLEARYKLALTGTPIRKKVGDIYEMVDWLTRLPGQPQTGVLGDVLDFHRLYEMRHGGKQGLNKILRTTCMIRRRKDQVLKSMPPKVSTVEIREAPFEVKGKLEAINSMISTHGLNDARRHIESLQSQIAKAPEGSLDVLSQELEQAFMELQKSMGVKGVPIQEMSALRRETGVAKIPWIIEIAERWLENDGGNFIIAFIHREVGQRLHDHFAEKSCMVIGGTSSHKRQQAINSFRKGEKEILLLSIGAGAEGANLQTSHRMIIAEFPWSYWKYDQARDRIHRPGQVYPCKYHHPIYAGSLDEKMMNLFVGENNTQKAVLK